MKKILKLIVLLLIAVFFLIFGSIDTNIQDEVVEIQPIPGPLGNTSEQHLKKNQENIIVADENLLTKQENIDLSEQTLNKNQENAIVPDQNSLIKQENIDVLEENLKKKQENNIGVSEQNSNKKQENNIGVSEENLNEKQVSGIVSDKNGFINQENKAKSEQNESKKQEIETKTEENLIVNQENKVESEQEGEAYSSINNNIFGTISYYENNVLTPLKGAKILIYGKGDNGLETIGEATSDITGKYTIVSTSGEALFYENFEVHINDSFVENMLLLNLEEDDIVDNNIENFTILDIANGIDLNFVMQPTFTGTVKSGDKNGSNISNATINLKTPYEMLVTKTDLNGIFSQQVKMQKIESQIIDTSVSAIDHNDYSINGKSYNITIDMLKQNKAIDMGIFVLESDRLGQLADKVYTLYYIKKTNNSLTLEWNKVSGATGYEIML